MAIALKLRNLLYIIHAVTPERVLPHIPPGLEPDLVETPEGPRAFLATVTLEAGAAFPYVLTGFRQVNYRIYVRRQGAPGVLFVRSWVSARAAAAALSLAIATEHASVEMKIQDDGFAYSRYEVQGRSGDHHIDAVAQAEPDISWAPFGDPATAIHFLTHRLTGYAAGHRGGLSRMAVSHAPMQPLPARVLSARIDQWTEEGILTPEEASRPVLALIQPEILFDMNLPEKINE